MRTHSLLLIPFAVALFGCPKAEEAPAVDPAPAAEAPAVEAAAEGAAEEAAAAPADGIPVREDDAARKSKNGHLEATIDGVDVDVRYGRPHVNDREVWGALVPFDAVWRTGADEATTVSVSADVMIGEEMLPAGVYSLFTIPTADTWTVIFNKTASQWGAYSYEADADALRVTVPSAEAEATDALTFESSDTGITLRWEKIAVTIPMAAVTAD